MSTIWKQCHFLIHIIIKTAHQVKPCDFELTFPLRKHTNLAFHLEMLNVNKFKIFQNFQFKYSLSLWYLLSI